MRSLKELVDAAYARHLAAGSNFSLKTLLDEAVADYEASEDVTDDPVAERIWQLVQIRDKQAKNIINNDDALDFGEFDFPAVLVTGKNERQPTPTALLEAVLADQAIKHEAKLTADQAFLRLERRNLALLPYLQQGMTVSMAIEAWKRDHP